MRNVLIYYYKENIAPTGGPRGYLYNLYQGLQKIHYDGIKISFLNIKEGYQQKSSRVKNIYNRLPLFFKNTYRIYGRYKEYRSFKFGIPELNIHDISSYDAIHFHDVFIVYKNRKLLETYKGKVIITTHCPKPPHLEKVEDMYSDFERFLYGKSHAAFYEECVKYAFERANYILFPCKEAEEPYYNNWDFYKTIHEKYSSKFIYVPTGLQDCLPKVRQSRSMIREKYDIPQDAFVISFVGRHNAVKGYDLLREIGHNIASDIYILIAGEESPLQRPNIKNWREAGWTNDPYSIISASDLFILPNKETYFDLVLLEVLSLGKPVIASQTGGNKYFASLNSGIKLFDCKEQAIEYINSLHQSPDNAIKMGEKNRKLFERYFTDERFAENYISLLKEL